MYMHVHVNFSEFQFRPVDRDMAGGAEGDDEGMCLESYMPTCSVSEEVVDHSRQPSSGSFGQRPHRWVAIGEGRTTPQWSRRGAASDRIPGGLQAPMARHPGPSATHVQSARRVRTRSDRNERVASGAPVSVCGVRARGSLYRWRGRRVGCRAVSYITPTT